MQNSVRVSVAFSFKGENYAPNMVVELDELMIKALDLPNLYVVLAAHNKIDTYSYLFEVMESYDLTFDEATGVAVECVENGRFNFENFQMRWHEQRALTGLALIAEKHLDIQNLNENTKLKAALLAAFSLGKDN